MLSDKEQWLTDAKIALMREFPFLSFAALSIEYRLQDNAYGIIPVPIAAVIMDPKPVMIINPDRFFELLPTVEERSFVIAHELLHLFFSHMGRQIDHNYNHELWNVATDYCINSYLVELGSYKIDMPKVGLYEEKYKDMTSDEIYAAILEENGGCMEDALNQFGKAGDLDGNMMGSGQPGEGEGEGEGKGTGKGVPFDQVFDKPMTTEQQAQVKALVAASLQNAKSDKNYSKYGDCALLRDLKGLLEPVLPWTTLLQNFMERSAKTYNTYNKYNRRSSKVIFPSLTGDHVNLVFGIDSSGSMSESDLKEGLSELFSIVETFESWKVDFITCDTVAHVIGSYCSEDGDEAFDISTEIVGGGGTNMNPMVDYAEELEETPACVVIVTDGYLPSIRNSDEVPVITVVTRNGSTDFEANGSEVVKIV